MTGLSGAGKTTIGRLAEIRLKEMGIKIERLDGDVVRQSLTRDLGFTKEDRDKNIERVTFVAKLLSRNNVGVLASFISPYQETRDMVREETTNFFEIYINAPLEVCAERDIKGLYEKAFAGEIPNFTGVSDPYEAPQHPDLQIDTHLEDPEDSVNKLIAFLQDQGIVPTVQAAS